MDHRSGWRATPTDPALWEVIEEGSGSARFRTRTCSTRPVMPRDEPPKDSSGDHNGPSVIHILKNGLALCCAGAPFTWPSRTSWISYLDNGAGRASTCKDCIVIWETLLPDADGPTPSQPNPAFHRTCSREP